MFYVESFTYEFCGSKSFTLLRRQKQLVFICVIRPPWDLGAFDVRKRKAKAVLLTRAIKHWLVTIDRTKIVYQESFRLNYSAGFLNKWPFNWKIKFLFLIVFFHYVLFKINKIYKRKKKQIAKNIEVTIIINVKKIRLFLTIVKKYREKPFLAKYIYCLKNKYSSEEVKIWSPIEHDKSIMCAEIRRERERISTHTNSSSQFTWRAICNSQLIDKEEQISYATKRIRTWRIILLRIRARVADCLKFMNSCLQSLVFKKRKLVLITK